MVFVFPYVGNRIKHEKNTYHFSYSIFILVFSLKCFNCIDEDHICRPGKLGEKVECKEGVKHCLKTWTGKFDLSLTYIKRKHYIHRYNI